MSHAENIHCVLDFPAAAFMLPKSLGSIRGKIFVLCICKFWRALLFLVMSPWCSIFSTC